MRDCLFCRIVAGEIPSSIVYESPTTLAFRDLHPKAPTHVLVIPKKHIATIVEFDATDDRVIVDMTRAVQEVVKLEKISSGFRVLVNNGKDARQMVAHVHYHVLGGRKFEDH